jgi:hypothetical protein
MLSFNRCYPGPSGRLWRHRGEQSLLEEADHFEQPRDNMVEYEGLMRTPSAHSHLSGLRLKGELWSYMSQLWNEEISSQIRGSKSEDLVLRQNGTLRTSQAVKCKLEQAVRWGVMSRR